jgi:uncharacterized SAM-binding protein YcdF (DUF218 family)
MRRWSVIATICVLLVGAFWCRGWLLPPVARWLNVGETPRPCDYVVPLPGGPQTRPFVAAALLRVGLAREAVVIQTIAWPDSEDGLVPPDHELTRQVLVRRGIEPSRIHVLESRSTSTFDDAQAVAAFLAGREGQTVAIVTSECHTRRARWIFRQVLADSPHRLHFVAAPDDLYDEQHWWQTRAGLVSYLAEYAKLAYYRFRYAPISTLLICAIPAVIAVWAVRRRRSKRPIALQVIAPD